MNLTESGGAIVELRALECKVLSGGKGSVLFGVEMGRCDPNSAELSVDGGGSLANIMSIWLVLGFKRMFKFVSTNLAGSGFL